MSLHCRYDTVACGLLTLHTVIAQRTSNLTAALAAIAIPLLSPAAVLAMHCAAQSYSHEAVVTWVRAYALQPRPLDCACKHLCNVRLCREMPRLASMSRLGSRIQGTQAVLQILAGYSRVL